MTLFSCRLMSVRNSLKSAVKPERAEAAPLGDVFITSTGDINVIDEAHLKRMKNGAVLANTGHFNVEINIPALEAMSRGLGERPWCAGNHLTLADIAVGCALGYLDLRMSDINWRKAYPNLGKLFDKLSKRASFRETAPPEQ